MYIVIEHNFSSGSGSTTFDISERFVPNQIFFVAGKRVYIGGVARTKKNSTEVAGYIMISVIELTSNSFSIIPSGQYAVDNNGYSTSYYSHVFYR